jgi:hypothetical protein
MAVDDLGKIVAAEISQRLSQIVDDEAIMVGKKLHLHLGDFPARDVKVEAIEKGPVFADDVWHWRKEMG